MTYTGEFLSINNINYKIEINTGGSGTGKLKLAGSPFVSNITSDDDTTIYNPIKCGGATVNLVTVDYAKDFYSGNPRGIKVTLTNTDLNKVEWVGYISPTCYSQGWDKYYETLSLDCIDGIAVLKNIKYASDEKKIKPFSQIIAYCLNQAQCFNTLYITDNVQISSATGTDSIIEQIRMSETGLFGKKDDVTQPDEDVAWSCYEVLYQICQFLGYTLVTEGDSVIILDYDAIIKGNNTYFKYNLGGSDLSNPTKTTLSFNHHINKDSYKENGTNIENTIIYNKVTVADEFNALNANEINTESATNITATSDPYFTESWIEGTGIGNWYDVCDTIKEEDDFGNNLTYQICVHKMHAKRWYYTIIKYYDDPRYKFYRYSKNSPYTQQNRTTDGVGYVMNSRGATLCKFCHIELGDDAIWHDSILYKNKNNLSAIREDLRKTEWVRLLNSKLANLNYTDCIVMMNGNQGKDGHISISNVTNSYEYKKADITDVNADSLSFTEPYMNYPYFEYEDENPAIFGNRNGKIVIKGTVTTHDEWWNPWPMNNGQDNDDLSFDKEQKCVYGMFIWAKLQWGDRWYNGRKNWVDRECFFKLYWWEGIDKKLGGRAKDTLIWDEHYVKWYFDKNLPISNAEEQLDSVVGESGYYINCPPDGNLNGKIKLTLYCPRDIWDLKEKRCDRYYTCVQSLSNFKIEASINTGGSLGDDSALDSDTVYTNLVDNGSTEPLDEITFKICTFDYKNTSYSVVDYLDNAGLSQWLDKTYNKANYSGEGQAMRQEEHLIYKLVTQYKDPHLIFNCNLKYDINPKLYGIFTDETLSGRKFIIQGIDYDYKFNKASLNLVEKV